MASTKRFPKNDEIDYWFTMLQKAFLPDCTDIDEYLLTEIESFDDDERAVFKHSYTKDCLYLSKKDKRIVLV
jgi:hypothetical protein